MSGTPAQLPWLLGWLNVSISFNLCQPRSSGYTGAPVPKCFNQRSSEPAPRKYCFMGVSPARQRREAVLPGRQWRDTPTPHAQKYPCVLQPGGCPTSPAASTNVTLYPLPPHPPTCLSGHQPPSKKLTAFYQVFPNCLPGQLSLISGDPEVWEGSSYSEPPASVCT